jgi:hypothetical protein
MNSNKLPNQSKIHVTRRFNVKSLYKSASVKTVPREIAKYVIFHGSTTHQRADNEQADNNTFFCGNKNAHHHFQSGLVIHKGITSVVKRVQHAFHQFLSIT